MHTSYLAKGSRITLKRIAHAKVVRCASNLVRPVQPKINDAGQMAFLDPGITEIGSGSRWALARANGGRSLLLARNIRFGRRQVAASAKR